MDEIKSESNTSVTEIYDNLIVSIAGEMTDANIVDVREIVTSNAYSKNVNGAILNFSAVSALDSFTFDAFGKLTRTLILMGVEVVWVGLRPGTVMALMDLNMDIDLDIIRTALNLEQGLDMLSNMKRSP